MKNKWVRANRACVRISLDRKWRGDGLALKLEDVLAARAHIKRMVHKTPLLYSRILSEKLGCEIFVKAEFLQKTGSFKARGVMNYLMTQSARQREYTTYSSGNHGQALAWGAQSQGCKATIFMPEDASPVKVAAVRNYGGQVRFAGLSSNDRYKACIQYAEENGAHVVPPYDHDSIIAGQGTAMLEILEELPSFDAALIPVGGGGLLSGNSLVLKTMRKTKTQVFACEPEVANDVKMSLEKGSIQKIPYPNTIADGVRNLCVGDRNWAIIKECVADGLLCSEENIKQAMALYATFTKQFVEPSGSVSLACLLANRDRFQGKKVVLIASGGNIAIKDYARLVGEDAIDIG